MAIHSKWHTSEQGFVNTSRWWHVTRPLHFGVVFVVLILSASLAWHFWTPNHMTQEEDSLLIQALPGPFRIRPDSPGAPDIPHQDKRIYDEITSHKGQTLAPSSLEIRPQPEEPVNLSSSESSDKNDEKNVSVSSLEEENLGDSFENKRFAVMLDPLSSEGDNKEVQLSVPETSQPSEQETPSARPLPLRKLFALDTPIIDPGTPPSTASSDLSQKKGIRSRAPLPKKKPAQSRKI